MASTRFGPEQPELPHPSPRILFGVTTGVSLPSFFGGQLKYLAQHGWEIGITCGNEADPGPFAASQGARYHQLEVTRSPNAWQDLRALVSLVHLLRTERPDLAVWGTPKVGLLGVVASALTRTPSIYVIHGLRLETARGAARAALWLIELASIRLADSAVAVGFQLRLRAAELHLAPVDRIHVIAHGSSNGVAPAALSPRVTSTPPSALRRIGFAGRVNPDKGLAELLIAWRSTHRRFPSARLSIAGGPEPDSTSQELFRALEAEPGVEVLGHVRDMNDFYAHIDALVLPSRREGLPNVVIEAAVRGIPAVVSDATGVSEPVLDGATGWIFPVGDVAALTGALGEVCGADADAIRARGLQAREHVLARYDRSRLWAAWDDYLRAVLTRTSSAGRWRLPLDQPAIPDVED